MEKLKLYMLLLGCTPPGRHTEQHDIFFGIGTCLGDLKEDIIASWPETKGDIHIDAWREVNYIDGGEIIITNRNEEKKGGVQLFFLNLGGYKKSEFDEFHYKLLIAATNMGDAVRQAKATAFYKHMGFKGAPSHIDEKYGIDVDDAFAVHDILPTSVTEKYSITIIEGRVDAADEIHLGYLKIKNI